MSLSQERILATDVTAWWRYAVPPVRNGSPKWRAI